MSRATDALITNVFERRIREAEQIAREFKAPQVSSGASGQLAYKIENNVDWDLDITLSPVPVTAGGFGELAFVVTYTGDGSQVDPVVTLLADVRVNGHPLSPEQGGYWIYRDSPTYPWTINVQSVDYANDDTTFFSEAYRRRWKFYFMYNNDSSISVRVKIRARASSAGTLSLTRTL